MSIQLKLSEPRMLDTRFGGVFPFLYRLPNGHLLARMSTGLDIMPDEREREMFINQKFEHLTQEQWIQKNLETCPDRTAYSDDTSFWWLRSKDNGKTFEDYGAPSILSIAQSESGELTGLARYTYQKDGVETCKMWRSADCGDSWDGPYDIPVQTPAIDREHPYIIFHRSIISLGGGVFLVPGYGRFEGDLGDRMFLYKTTDNFKTLYYYSTIAYDPTVEGHSLDEGDVIRTPDGRLLCVMRNNSYLPMYQCWSDNDGASWSGLEMVGSEGVDPALERLDDVLFCTYGRPGVWLMCSENNGERWTNRTCLYNSPYEISGKTRGERAGLERSCCYTDVEKLNDHQLLVLYTRPIDPSDSSVMSPWKPEQLGSFRMFAVEVTVER